MKLSSRDNGVVDALQNVPARGDVAKAQELIVRLVRDAPSEQSRMNSVDAVDGKLEEVEQGCATMQGGLKGLGSAIVRERREDCVVQSHCARAANALVRELYGRHDVHEIRKNERALSFYAGPHGYVLGHASPGHLLAVGGNGKELFCRVHFDKEELNNRCTVLQTK